MGFDIDGVVAADRHVAGARDALATIIGGGKVNGDVAPADADVGIALDSCAIGWVIVDHLSGTTCFDGNVATTDVDFTDSLDAFRYVA